MRETLIEFLENMTDKDGCHLVEFTLAEKIADNLIANRMIAQQWIPVSERLPERFENVLCYFPEKDYGSPVMVDYNESTREEIAVFARQYKWGKVTHWMPLPEYPKEVAK